MINDDFLFYLKDKHTGEENYITSGDLENLFCINGKKVRKIVNELRCNGQPVCSDVNGYFYAENRNEIDNTAQQLLGRTRKINEAVSGLILSHQIFYDGLEW